MTTNYFKQITLATIGTGCIALGVATEAQAFGTLNISNERGFIGDADTIEFSHDDIEYFGTGDFDFLVGPGPDLEGDGSVYLGPLDVPGDGVDSFFTFDDNSPFVFNLSSINLAFEFQDIVSYNLEGTITDGTKSYKVGGRFTSQMMPTSGDTGSAWSATLEKVPEPTTVLGLGVVAVASAFGLKKKNS